MRTRQFSTVPLALLVSFVCARAGAAQSEQPLSPVQTAIACALVPEALPSVEDRLVVVGSQDTTVRSLFGSRDLVVLNGGTAQHVDIGQRYFVRRPEWFGPHAADRPHTIRTAGWVTVVSSNEKTAIALVEYACGDIQTGDYLEPFAAPVVPADVDRNVPARTLGFDDAGRILYGDHLRWTAGTGGFMVVDRGIDRGATVGTRFAVYRDLGQPGVPLVWIGEVIVVSAGPSTAVVRVTSGRDAVTAGDYAVPHR